MNKEEKINEYFNALFSKRYQKYSLLFNNLEVLSKSQLFLEKSLNLLMKWPTLLKKN